MLIGIVGKPSCGKSTFFKAATLAEAEIASYPFTTIKPNHGVGYVRVNCVDKEFGKKCNPRFGYCREGIRFVPVDMLDVAGLVPGAHEGKGRGNQLLDDLRQADVLIHVIDVSGGTNENGEEVPIGSYDPVNDVKFLEEELDYWYFGIIKKGWANFVKETRVKKGDLRKNLAKQLSGLRVTEEMVDESVKNEEISSWNDLDLMNLAINLRKKTKPIIIACNKVDVSVGKDNFDRLKKEFSDCILIPCSAESELALREADNKELIEYLPGSNDFLIKGGLNEKQEKGLNFIKDHVLSVYNNTGVQEVLDRAVFELLGCFAVFPGGVNKLEDSKGRVLPDCFLMPKGSSALDFAYKLHSDFGDNFIRAVDVKSKMTVGRDHKLKHRDVIEIISGK